MLDVLPKDVDTIVVLKSRIMGFVVVLCQNYKCFLTVAQLSQCVGVLVLH